MTRPVVFSASSINSYINCHLQWFFGYVAAMTGETSEPQRVGIAVHDAAETVLRKFPAPNYVDVLADHPSVIPLTEVFLRDILPTYRNPVLIEAEFQIEVNGIPYSGILDSVDEHDTPWGSSLILRDLKTTGSRPAGGRYRFAMTGYWLGATDLGYEPDAAQLDYIVRTKTPYYWPEVMDPITDDDISIFAATLETVANGVESGDYRPTGLGTWACKSCSFRGSCGPYIRYQEVTNANES